MRGDIIMDERVWDSLTPESYRALKPKLGTDAAIARYFNVSHGAVTHFKERAGIDTRSPRQLLIDKYPFGRIPAKFAGDQQNRRLRDHAELMATGKVARWKKRELLKFYRYLRANNVVVAYSPDAGWSYMERMPTDFDLLFRKETAVRELAEEDYTVWSFPPDDLLA